MPDLTPRLGIKKPLGNENVTRAAFNENYDIIDANVATKAEGQTAQATADAALSAAQAAQAKADAAQSKADAAVPLDGSVAMVGDLNMGDKIIYNARDVRLTLGTRLGESSEQRTFLNAVADRFDLITQDGLNYILRAIYATNEFSFKGNKIWHSGNDGAGSGLDADTVRGYVPVNKAGDTMTGSLTIHKSSVPEVYLKADRTNSSRIYWNASSTVQDGVHIVVDGDDVFKVMTTSAQFKVNNTWYTFWHAGNLGPGKIITLYDAGTWVSTSSNIPTANVTHQNNASINLIDYSPYIDAAVLTGRSVYIEAVIRGSGGTVMFASEPVGTTVSTTSTSFTRVRSGVFSYSGGTLPLYLWTNSGTAYLAIARLIIL